MGGQEYRGGSAYRRAVPDHGCRQAQGGEVVASAGAGYRLTARLQIPRARDDVFAFFAAAENLERITPPELQFRMVTPAPVTMAAGTLIDYRLRLHGLPFRWRTLISTWQPPEHFVDEQLRGPYRQWIHSHRFIEVPGGTVIEDQVDYILPFGILGRLVQPMIRIQLDRIFSYRTTAVASLLGGA